MWLFIQKTGELKQNGQHVAAGYAGKGAGKNNPAAETEHGIGPLPCGSYTIAAPHTSPHTGPYTLDLIPNPANEMFGRSLFRIHGDSIALPGTASDGCIILPRPIREKIWGSGDHQIEVIATPSDEIHSAPIVTNPVNNGVHHA